MVTQTLHIPPSTEVAEANLETEKLRKEVKKLREYYRLSVQGIKGNLKDKIQENLRQKSMSPCYVRPDTLDNSVQCNLLETKVKVIVFYIFLILLKPKIGCNRCIFYLNLENASIPFRNSDSIFRGCCSKV